MNQSPIPKPEEPTGTHDCAVPLTRIGAVQATSSYPESVYKEIVDKRLQEGEHGMMIDSWAHPDQPKPVDVVLKHWPPNDLSFVDHYPTHLSIPRLAAGPWPKRAKTAQQVHRNKKRAMAKASRKRNRRK